MSSKIYLLLLTLFISAGSQSQVIYEEFTSSKLGEVRKLKIQLPRNYDANTQKNYPVVLVLDADYLFEPVAGNVDYYSYWEEMPEAIVVGVMQQGLRNDDGYYDNKTFFPSEKGANFFEFIGMELMPHIDKNYRTAKFVLAVGHEFTANFINYYLFKDPPLFKAYIALSPDLAPMMETRIPERMPQLSSKIFYYLATASNDLSPLRKASLELHNGMSAVKQPNVHYYFADFKGASHYSLVGKAIPDALENIFSVYRPITKKDYDEILLKLETPVYDYLIEKYATIENLFGLKSTVRLNDVIAVATASEKKKEWDSLEKVAKLAKKEHPEIMLGDYYLARFYEETGEPKKAMRTYQAAYNLKDVAFITAELVLEKADQIKKDFNY